jgi:hypothetical protein
MEGGVRSIPNPNAPPLDLPSSNPHVALNEIERRREQMQSAQNAAAVGTATLPPDRNRFLKESSGYWVVNFGNLEYSNRCMVPNIRLLEFVRAADNSESAMAAALRAANAKVVALAADPRIQSKPEIVPANTPVQVSYSQASGVTPSHVLPKIARNLQRHAQFYTWKQQEFDEHVEKKKEGVMEKSSYHRWQKYGRKKKTLQLASNTGPAEPLDDDTVTAADALRQCAAEGRAIADAIVLTPVRVETYDSSLPDIGGGDDIETPVAVDLFPSTPAVAADGPNMFFNTNAAPKPVLDHIPQKWLTNNDQVVEPWPRDLEVRGKHACISIIDDLDVPADTPDFPAAAGMEPVIILFGEMYTDVETGKESIHSRIGPWCKDLNLSLVDMYEWLWPTEVDEDKIPEEHRTGNSSNNEELGKIMSSRLHQLKLSSEVQKIVDAGGPGATIPVTYVNSQALLDVDNVVAAAKPSIYIQSIEQTQSRASTTSSGLPDI